MCEMQMEIRDKDYVTLAALGSPKRGSLGQRPNVCLVRPVPGGKRLIRWSARVFGE